MFILLSIADGGSHGSYYFYERFVCCNFGGNGTPPRNWYCPTSHYIIFDEYLFIDVLISGLQ